NGFRIPGDSSGGLAARSGGICSGRKEWENKRDRKREGEESWHASPPTTPRRESRNTWLVSSEALSEANAEGERNGVTLHIWHGERAIHDFGANASRGECFAEGERKHAFRTGINQAMIQRSAKAHRLPVSGAFDPLSGILLLADDDRVSREETDT